MFYFLFVFKMLKIKIFLETEDYAQMFTKWNMYVNFEILTIKIKKIFLPCLGIKLH